MTLPSVAFQQGSTNGKRYSQLPVPPTELHSPSLHVETTQQKLEEVLLEHEAPSDAFLEELQALEEAPQLSEEELTRQALEAGGADGDNNTPE